MKKEMLEELMDNLSGTLYDAHSALAANDIAKFTQARGEAKGLLSAADTFGITIEQLEKLYREKGHFEEISLKSLTAFLNID